MIQFSLWDFLVFFCLLNKRIINLDGIEDMNKMSVGHRIWCGAIATPFILQNGSFCRLKIVKIES